MNFDPWHQTGKGKCRKKTAYRSRWDKPRTKKGTPDNPCQVLAILKSKNDLTQEYIDDMAKEAKERGYSFIYFVESAAGPAYRTVEL